MSSLHSNLAAPQLTIVVPIYNEESSLQALLPSLLHECETNNWLLVCVDDGSTDSTRAILSEFESSPVLNILHHKVNRGYGAALKTGILSCATPYVATFDGDGQHRPEELEGVLSVVLEHGADLVVGDRGRVPAAYWFRGLGKWIIRRFARSLMPLPIRDLNSGFKVMRTELAKVYAPLCPKSMAFSDVITLIFVNQGNLVMEHPIRINPRKAGKSTIRVYTAIETIMEILNLAMMFNPMRIFLVISAICILFGIGWGIPLVMMGRGVSVGAMLAIVTGLLFFFMGLIASQLSAIRMGALDTKENTKGPREKA